MVALDQQHLEQGPALVIDLRGLAFDCQPRFGLDCA